MSFDRQLTGYIGLIKTGCENPIGCYPIALVSTLIGISDIMRGLMSRLLKMPSPELVWASMQGVAVGAVLYAIVKYNFFM